MQQTLKTYVIERPLPGAGNLSDADLRGIAAKSNGVLRDLGPDVQWVHSYVTGDKVYCIHIASSADVIRAHAERTGVPANRISEIKASLDPTSGGA